MAPNRGSSSKSSSKPSNKSSSSSKSKSKPLASSSRVSKPKSKSSIHRPLPKEVKAKPRTAPENLKKRKKRIYTEKELDLPQLNMITPVGVTKPKGMKKGKVFVDDQKEGQIESKMMKARQMEEIREARRKEAEARQMEKKEKLEKVKDSLRKKRRPDSGEGKSDGKNSSSGEAKEFSSSKPSRSKPNRKRVSFT
ncbi:60S ribosomal subunit assembly/export protein LOC1 [Histoplasma capsulatum G186AR]|uniref:60S ribosomal subunit assembly/export protein LOC1 n=1 Tax=Ajellomyces capsulatus (strain G186AR / H82 / ATCC MYA-2454 / RMSCC 2432) TaxID=447093 RepID=C0NZW7_AJECG|nr:60S ribosomal subunit assembly/export protein LOC1 [Histoplasma capsulatum G186AR]EEH03057.1 60S ribosomal subunit assembly/export protein LOC1 [Histoplasma capsulatum G186AR]